MVGNHESVTTIGLPQKSVRIQSSGAARKSEPKNLLEELQKKDIVERS
ncbi:hypothetical protein FOPG_07498 [Fusarium oxysporum f. sp. conglutinans race 2 54008]|uniref:Uncharacterized protein n=1 Tax=Fusarium oxysporum f. sp. conglutinans race 2 54008 TaxID=1089457 RepID=X0I2K5_FUSOX|nr:hypothetical protein FOPG_07498 [Fusarium oxysporum f. sp. conglutinans race 2 54008]